MKKITVIFIALFALSIGVYANEKPVKKHTPPGAPIKRYTQEAWDKKMKTQEQESWRADLKLEYPGEWLKGVMYILTEKDPMENFQEDLKKRYEYYIETSKLKDSKEQHIQWSWNSILSTVDGSRVSFIENHPSANSVYSVGGNNFNKQWLVTRAIGNNGKTICWSVPVNFKKGKTVEITLTDKNTVNYEKLEKIYDSIIKEELEKWRKNLSKKR